MRLILFSLLSVLLVSSPVFAHGPHAPDMSVAWGAVVDDDAATAAKASQFFSVQALLLELGSIESGVAVELGLAPSGWRFYQVNRAEIVGPVYAGVDFRLYDQGDAGGEVGGEPDDDDNGRNRQPRTVYVSPEASWSPDTRLVVGVGVARVKIVNLAVEALLFENVYGGEDDSHRIAVRASW